jgi:hypothetical protein
MWSHVNAFSVAFGLTFFEAPYRAQNKYLTAIFKSSWQTPSNYHHILWEKSAYSHPLDFAEQG